MEKKEEGVKQRELINKYLNVQTVGDPGRQGIFPIPMTIQDPSQVALVVKYHNKNQELTQYYEELPQIKANALRDSLPLLDPSKVQQYATSFSPGKAKLLEQQEANA